MKTMLRKKRACLTDCSERLLGEDTGICISQKVSGHSAAVTQVQWVTSGKLLPCSGDSTVALWDVVTGKREKCFKAHSAVVNTCSAASLSPLAASGSDDSWLRLWDLRLSVKTANVSSSEHDYQILSVSMDAPGRWTFMQVHWIIVSLNLIPGEWIRPRFWGSLVMV